MTDERTWSVDEPGHSRTPGLSTLADSFEDAKEIAETMAAGNAFRNGRWVQVNDGLQPGEQEVWVLRNENRAYTYVRSSARPE